MRIIAGELRHRLLAAPPDSGTTRPIPDRVKESIFSLLRGHFEGANVFDGFSGVGTIGLECVSRGAEHVVLVEQDKKVAEYLRRNVESMGVLERCEVVVGDALGVGGVARARHPLNLAFLDPPYRLVEEPVGFARVMAQLSRLVEMLDPAGFAVLRTPWPLMHGGTPSEAPKEAPVRRYKDKSKARREWKRDMVRRAKESEPQRETVELTEEEIARAMAGEDVTPGQPVPGRSGTPANMTLLNATGPETHVYRDMAVHLYMKKAGA